MSKKYVLLCFSYQLQEFAANFITEDLVQIYNGIKLFDVLTYFCLSIS